MDLILSIAVARFVTRAFSENMQCFAEADQNLIPCDPNFAF